MIAAVAPRAFLHLARRYRAAFARDLLRVGTMGQPAGLRGVDGAAVEPRGWDHIRA
ncbi:MAG: hypothetical protein ABR591_02550 [Candidatus Velthaea sp.]